MRKSRGRAKQVSLSRPAMKKCGYQRYLEDLLQKIIFTLGGFLIGTLIIITCLKITGLWWSMIIGMAVDCGIGWYLYKKFPSQPDKKLIARGLFISVATITLAGAGIWIFANMLMEGISG